MERALKAKPKKLADIYFKMAELKKEYEDLRNEVISKIDGIVDVGNAVISKSIFTEYRLILPDNVRKRLKKKYGKEIVVERLNIRRKE